MRTVHNLVQGEPDWHAHRNTPGMFNASEIAAVMGLSSYVSRAELLRRKATGIEPEYDAATLARFAQGHAAEEAARPLAEEIIGDDLSPMIMSDTIDGLLFSVSFDGITLDYGATWEHKKLNQALAAALDAGEIPVEYHPQMEVGLMVSGATRCLFMASNGDPESMRHVWYESNPALRAKIIAACKQFAEDVANYQHVEAKPEAVAAPIEALPALLVQVEGRVVATNLDVFKEKAGAFIASIKTELVTDQDFADADKMTKFLGDGEKQLAAVKMQAQAQAQSIDEVFRAIDAISEQMRATRLKLEKLVKTEKENRKANIVAHAQDALRAHIYKLNDRIGGDFFPLAMFGQSRFVDAIKGLKSLSAMQDTVNTALAHAKIEANEIADRIEANKKVVDALDDTQAALFADLRTILLKDTDDFKAVVYARVEEHKQRQESERERIRKEEAARLEREAQDQRGKTEGARPLSPQTEVLHEAASASTPPTPAYAVCEQHTPDLKTRLDQFFASVGTPKAKQANYSAVIMAWEEFNGRATKPAEMEAAA